MIEVSTRNTPEIYKEFFWFSLFRGRFFRYKRMLYLVLMLLSYVVFACISYRTHTYFLMLKGTSFIWAMLSTLFYGMCLIQLKVFTRKSSVLFQPSIRYIFNQNDYSIIESGDLIHGTETIKYEAISRVYETKNAFYLYLTPTKANIISKKDIVVGTPEDLNNLLQQKYQNKYVICK
jgi:hypothetical protein